MNLTEFYPTPQKLIDKMLYGVDFQQITTVLEPSAGKGDIVAEVNRKLRYAQNKYGDDDYRGDIDCVEIDEDLRGVLKNKNYRVVHNDFLTYRSAKKYDLIVMNPPFSDGDKHLMKAIEIQEVFGGSVVCLLNAETLKNPYTNLRKTLVRRLDELDAGIEYLPGEFESAERRTNVEVALIKIVIPKKGDSLIIEHLKKAKEREEQGFIEPSAVVQGDFIKAIIDQYNFEVDAGVNLIKEYEKISPYIMKELSKEEKVNYPILELKIRSGDRYSNDKNLINDYVKKVRVKYWRGLFEKPEFVRNLTSNLQQELNSRVNELSEYEFSYHNIMELQIEVNKKTIQKIEDTIIKLFDELSHKYSYYDEMSKNIHYYDGWKTNKSYKINKKVIIPLNAFNEWRGSYDFRAYRMKGKLEDIEKCLSFLDGGETTNINIETQLDIAEKSHFYQNIELKYFNVTFYKKGTCHITFTNERLLEKFNIFGCQRKGWLPPSYGKKRRENMTQAEITVVDSFHEHKGGLCHDYDGIVRDSKYYIVENGQLLLTGA